MYDQLTVSVMFVGGWFKSVICNWQSYSRVPVLSIGRVVEKAFVLVVSLGIFNRSFYLNCAGLCLFTCFFVIYKINKDRSPLPMLCGSAELTSSEGLFLQGAAPSGELGGVDFVLFPHIFHSFIKDQYFQIKDKWLWGYLCNSKKFFLLPDAENIFHQKKSCWCVWFIKDAGEGLHCMHSESLFCFLTQA